MKKYMTKCAHDIWNANHYLSHARNIETALNIYAKMGWEFVGIEKCDTEGVYDTYIFQKTTVSQMPYIHNQSSVITKRLLKTK